MSTSSHDAGAHLERVLREKRPEEILERLRPSPEPLPPRVPGASLTTPEAIERRWRLIPHAARREELLGAHDLARAEVYARNIENYIGMAKLPVGLIGPLRVRGLYAGSDYYVPLATTEAALVASYHRGATVVSESGGCTALLVAEGVSRAPGFAFRNLLEAGAFVKWALEELERFREVAASTTRHGKLVEMKVMVEGNHVYLSFEFLTGDAAGQNMVTIATQAICDHIRTHTPVVPAHFFVEANLSGDKKASAQSFQAVRGRKVAAEVTVPRTILEKRLHTTAEQMENYWRMSAMGGVLSGTIGVQGHYANGLAALYIATGQDAACVAESSVGVTRFEAVNEGDLYASVTLPNLIVGTVGGGTGLPTQRACLDILGLCGEGKARAFAEVAAALALAGELSIIGALSAHHFSRAHERLARRA